MAVERRTRERFYRGLKEEELIKLNIREFSKLVKSRARRAINRNADVIEKFTDKCKKNSEKNKPIRTHNRELVIVPAMMGKTISVHNGKEFVPVKIEIEMLGKRLGEFAMTRRVVKHGAAGVGATKSSAALSVK